MNKHLVLRSDAIRQRAIVWLQSLRVDPDAPLEIVIRDLRVEKTHEQRKLFHSLCRDVGKHLGLEPAAVKQAIKADYFGVDFIEIGGKVYHVIPSSEEPDKSEYSELIEFALQWAAEHGVLLEAA